MVIPAVEAGLQLGTLVMQPAKSSFQSKEVPLETFFHKIVMIRNNLRVLKQRVNASDPPSPRLRRAKQTERSGHRSAAVPLSESANASAHSKNGM